MFRTFALNSFPWFFPGPQRIRAKDSSVPGQPPIPLKEPIGNSNDGNVLFPIVLRQIVRPDDPPLVSHDGNVSDVLGVQEYHTLAKRAQSLLLFQAKGADILPPFPFGLREVLQHVQPAPFLCGLLGTNVEIGIEVRLGNEMLPCFFEQQPCWVRCQSGYDYLRASPAQFIGYRQVPDNVTQSQRAADV